MLGWGSPRERTGKLGFKECLLCMLMALWAILSVNVIMTLCKRGYTIQSRLCPCISELFLKAFSLFSYSILSVK